MCDPQAKKEQKALDVGDDDDDSMSEDEDDEGAERLKKLLYGGACVRACVRVGRISFSIKESA